MVGWSYRIKVLELLVEYVDPSCSYFTFQGKHSVVQSVDESRTGKKLPWTRPLRASLRQEHPVAGQFGDVMASPVGYVDMPRTVYGNICNGAEDGIICTSDRQYVFYR